jgi:hemoglobin
VSAVVVAVAASSVIVGCAESKPAKIETKPLYVRLGGEETIKKVVDDFVTRAASDPAVNFFRKDVPGYPEWKPSAEELAAFKTHLYQFVELAAGAPVKYEGKSMKESHKGMKITQAQFNAIAADLKASLDHFKVAQKEQDELLGAVAGTAPDIVEVK